MGSLFELFGSIATLLFSSLKDITEEEIDKNIKILHKYQWFQEYLDNENYMKLIYENDDVRHIIGKLNIERMRKNFYQNKKRKKIYKALQKNSL